MYVSCYHIATFFFRNTDILNIEGHEVLSLAKHKKAKLTSILFTLRNNIMLGIIWKYYNKLSLSEYQLTADVTRLIKSEAAGDYSSISSRYAHWVIHPCCTRILCFFYVFRLSNVIYEYNITFLCLLLYWDHGYYPYWEIPINISRIIMIGPYFVGAFVKLRKATISFVISARLSVRMEQLGCHWKDFYEIWYWNISRKYVEKIQLLLKSDMNKA